MMFGKDPHLAPIIIPDTTTEETPNLNPNPNPNPNPNDMRCAPHSGHAVCTSCRSCSLHHIQVMQSAPRSGHASYELMPKDRVRVRVRFRVRVRVRKLG